MTKGRLCPISKSEIVSASPSCRVSGRSESTDERGEERTELVPAVSLVLALLLLCLSSAVVDAFFFFLGDDFVVLLVLLVVVVVVVVGVLLLFA